MRASGMLKRLYASGVKCVEVQCVEDNIMARPGDPVFLGGWACLCLSTAAICVGAAVCERACAGKPSPCPFEGVPLDRGAPRYSFSLPTHSHTNTHQHTHTCARSASVCPHLPHTCMHAGCCRSVSLDCAAKAADPETLMSCYETYAQLITTAQTAQVRARCWARCALCGGGP